ncbi:maleylacetoacetate isomerase [Burkholderia diffusa]|uniref:Maleylacetoacetate isomerase n=1 Tax=Burkholderia diffusa TaxID=488732 RepID=A0AAW3P9A0_9BURK|nr:maleylacetoacetate isomerase [Burkholderia diffusa]KWF32774.1 maleylacetoacetate isomerase [Burkholderia diffusa]KWF38696.1 maleylacetoacetate isomerase [Burkholderia diffusa]KWF46741.1 maleylacetoacetate isomerase [Burkholderia diffusa]KWF50688.1 maleylacetoacetate isomerase [Burkholderia diffusa]
MKLYSFFNSSASYRVRIALALKGLAYECIPVNIRTGQHRALGYVETVNPSASVPAFEDGDFRLGQSLAIIDYLDAIKPEPRLIPADLRERARVLELTTLISCDIHPINNLRVLKYLDTVLNVDAEQKRTWYHHWIHDGMAGIERLLTKYGHGEWCFGQSPTLADITLIPQMANAIRMDCDLSLYPRAKAIYEKATAHSAFMSAEPARQPDFTT